MGILPLGEEHVSTKVFTEIFKKINSQSNFFIDIGASDGIAYDPTHCLSRTGWNGISFEASAEKYDALCLNLHSGIIKVNTLVTPENIIELLKENRVHKKLGAFSVDIDGYDYFVLQKILEAGYSFSSICVECNTIFPPGINWTVLYKEGYFWSGNTHFLGCSLSLYDKLMKKYGYEIIHYDWENAYYVQKQDFNKFGVIDNSLLRMWSEGYWNRTKRGYGDYFSWNNDFWITGLAPHLQLHFIRNHKHIKVHKENEDFLLFHDNEYVNEKQKYDELLELL